MQAKLKHSFDLLSGLALMDERHRKGRLISFVPEFQGSFSSHAIVERVMRRVRSSTNCAPLQRIRCCSASIKKADELLV